MEKSKSGIQRVGSETSSLSLVTAVVFDEGLSMALWRLPNATNSTLIVSNTLRRLKSHAPLESLPPGFIFAPYCEDNPGIFIEREISFTVEGDVVSPPGYPLESVAARWLDDYRGSHASKRIRIAARTLPALPANEKEHYLDLVRKSIESIEQGRFEKVVPSRIKRIALGENFDLLKTYQNLCSEHPEALISLVHIPDAGTWIGASPEILVSVENGTIFRTVALAGTQPYDGRPVKSVAWTQKEIEEQALVERYIISCFKKIRLREYEEHGPKTVVAGKLMHLRSDFTVDMNATNFPQLGSVMLELLHPTSAVCGMALEPAREFLRLNEGYDRLYYTGYLGPVNIQRNTDIYVNLRCMQLTGRHALLYAGAGVTGDSVPESEWEETEMKFNTLSTSLT
jgi:isochorismate synthase